jgi:hypothetical protein
MDTSRVADHQFWETALVAGDRCPICGQPIPNEMLDEMRHRMETHDQSLSQAAVAHAARQFAAERAEIEAASRQAVEVVRDALERDRTETSLGFTGASHLWRHHQNASLPDSPLTKERGHHQ